MRRFSPPSPEIELYEDGFKAKDLLGREGLSKQLSKLVDHFDEPLVVALDGRWGDGKSFFLKCWCGAHTKENGGTALTVYVDAFKSDFLNDPLITLTSALADRLPQEEEASESIERLKNAARVSLRSASRVVLAAVSSGLSELTGPILSAALDKTDEEISQLTKNAWNEVEVRESGIWEFREQLESIVADDEEKRNIVFVVDELDRCRPDYAIELIEVAKHFFSVNNVHFVLGVNLTQFERFIEHRFGQDTETDHYLRKYISLSLSLPHKVTAVHRSPASSLHYFREIGKEMNIDKYFLRDVDQSLVLVSQAQPVSLRDIDRILSATALIPLTIDQDYHYFSRGNQILLSVAVIIRVLDADLLKRLIDGSADFKEIKSFIGIYEKPGKRSSQGSIVLWQVFAVCLAPEEMIEEMGYIDLFGSADMPNKDVVSNFLGQMMTSYSLID